MRIARADYAWLSAPVRSAAELDRPQWGRFDSPGATLYIAETGEVAFAEVLSALKRRLNEQDPLEADAAALGIPLAELVARLATDWADDEVDGHDVVPRGWLSRRRRLDVALLPGGP